MTTQSQNPHKPHLRFKVHPHAQRLMMIDEIDETEARSLAGECAFDEPFFEALGISAETVVNELSALLIARLSVVKSLGGNVVAENYGALAALAACAQIYLADLPTERRTLVDSVAKELHRRTCVVSVKEYVDGDVAQRDWRQ